MSERSPPDGGPRTSPDGEYPRRFQEPDRQRSATDGAATAEENAELVEFLTEHDLDRHCDALQAAGIRKVAHLADVQEEDCEQLGMGKFEARRLMRVFEKWKKHRKSTISKRLVRMLGGSSSGSGGGGSGSAGAAGSNTSGAGKKGKTLAGGQSHSEAPVPVASVCLIQPQELHITRLLGKGSFGTVNQAVWTMADGTKRIVAVKTLDASSDKQLASRFIKEANILHQVCSHPHIIQLLGIGIDSLMLVTELAPEGSLLTKLRQRPMSLSVLRLYLFAEQVAEAMVYLERKGLVHRDLAARNVLLMDGETAKISDFGLSRMAASDLTTVNRTYTSPVPIAWTAPEAVTLNRFSHKSDVWSYGVTVWEMFSAGEKPYEGKQMFEIITLIQPPRSYRLPRPRLCSPQTYDLLKLCWHCQPDKRPDFRLLKDLMKASRPPAAKVVSNHKPGRGCDKELPLSKGEMITVIDRSDVTAYFGQNSQLKVGTFPAGRVHLVAAEAASSDVADTRSKAAGMAAETGKLISLPSSPTCAYDDVLLPGAGGVVGQRRTEISADDFIGLDIGGVGGAGRSAATMAMASSSSSSATSLMATTTNSGGYMNMAPALPPTASAATGPGVASSTSSSASVIAPSPLHLHPVQRLASPPLPNSDYANAEMAAAHLSSGLAAKPGPTRPPRSTKTSAGYLMPSDPSPSSAVAGASGAGAGGAGGVSGQQPANYALLSSAAAMEKAPGRQQAGPPVAPFSAGRRPTTTAAASGASTKTAAQPASQSAPSSHYSVSIGGLASGVSSGHHRSSPPQLTSPKYDNAELAGLGAASTVAAALPVMSHVTSSSSVTSSTASSSSSPTARPRSRPAAVISDPVFAIDRHLFNEMSGVIPSGLSNNNSAVKPLTVGNAFSTAGTLQSPSSSMLACKASASASRSSSTSSFSPSNPFSADQSGQAQFTTSAVADNSNFISSGASSSTTAPPGIGDRSAATTAQGAPAMPPSSSATAANRKSSSSGYMPLMRPARVGGGGGSGGDRYEALRDITAGPQRSTFESRDFELPTNDPYTRAAGAVFGGSGPPPTTSSSASGFVAAFPEPQQQQHRHPPPSQPATSTAATFTAQTHTFAGQQPPSPATQMRQLVTPRPALKPREASLPYQPGRALPGTSSGTGGSSSAAAAAAVAEFPITSMMTPTPFIKATQPPSAPTAVPTASASASVEDRLASATAAAAAAVGGGGGAGVPVTTSAGSRPRWPLPGMSDGPTATTTTTTAAGGQSDTPGVDVSSGAKGSPSQSEQAQLLENLMQRSAGRQRQDCLQALRCSQWNIQSAFSYLCVHELLSLGIAGTDAVLCLRALEHCGWKVDRAAEWLLQLQENL